MKTRYSELNLNPMSVSRFLLFGLAFFVGASLQAREHVGADSKSNRQNVQAKAAGCSPAQSLMEFYVNNVRTAAETAGNVWYDRPNENPYYEVPAGEGNHAIFAGSLWMGGEDPAGNLKLAAVRFRQVGNDYWPGPLSTDGAASVTPETCELWDRFFPISRQMVERHRYYFTLLLQGIDPSTDPLFENEPYVIPPEILNWPAHGDVTLGQSYTVAPFADMRDPITGEVVGTEGTYEPMLGDYPLYDLEQEIDCRTRLVTDPVPLFGDFTMYWVMNDKGNVHTESGGEPIGMEIQAQMFGFATNDEINNMTFCNYVLINRGSLTLRDTYFAQWVDTDLGDPRDDFVGCDVVRGLGYSYNGKNFDGSSGSGPGYGAQPPAIGVDFFEGPYQDADGINNKVGIGFDEALNGLGYHDPDALEPDSIIDNERFGMRRFLYFINNTDPVVGDPRIAIEYYNLMRGIWKNGAPMTFGGNGYNPGDPTAIRADFMFPGDSDPLHWGTQGVDPGYGIPGGWTEENEGNAPEDRRFLQSAGPFTLQPGQFNNITVGVVYARAATGGPFASVTSLLQADDKAQALFENCFRLLDGPDAPDLTAQELDKRVILYLRNTNPLSNNVGESYEEIDPTIPPFDTAGVANDQTYRFQGYQVYQLKNSEVSIADIDDTELSRLVFQVDVVDYDEFGNPIGRIINYEFDSELGLPVPVEKVNGANEGIRHSFEVTNDQFASGDTRLINFKKYYYLAVAYGYNNYEDYNPVNLTGQSRPYLRGRSAAAGEIKPLVVIPHKPVPEKFGTVFATQYGDGVPITRIEGAGNGRKNLELERSSIDDIMDGSPWKADELTYKPGAGPINVKVVDPLNVKEADFELRFYNATDADGNYVGDFNDARWYMVDRSNPSDTIWSETSIQVSNEQIVPEYGISVDIGQYGFEVVNTNADRDKWKFYPALLGSGIEHTHGGDAWLGGVPDQDGASFFNWIRSGIISVDAEASGPCFLLPEGGYDPSIFNDYPGRDDRQIFEDVAGGILSPAYLAANYDCGPAPLNASAWGVIDEEYGKLASADGHGSVGSVELFITSDKSKWTRAMVFEMQHDMSYSQGNATKMQPRGALSVDKNGRTQLDPQGNYDEATYGGEQVITQAYLDQMTSGMTQDQLDALLATYRTVVPSLGSLDELVGLSFGMGWFPGYALDPSTGERLNISFAENSYLAADNGRDMLWNPTSRIAPMLPGSDQFYFGGQHFVYVYRNQARIRPGVANEVPMYDGSQTIYDNYHNTSPSSVVRLNRRNKNWRALDWIYFPLAVQEDPYLPVEEGLIPSEVRLYAHVGSPYKPYATLAEELGDASLPYVPTDQYRELSQNNWYPMYEFNTLGIQTLTEQTAAAKDALDLIDIVPNPYYAYSSYETSRIENTVKFINLPPRVTIKVFTMNGTLVRVLNKDNPDTWLEWDMMNESFIPLAGGMYLIHVEAPTLGERVIKFFAATRPTDLRNF